MAVGGLCRVAEFCAHGMISRASYFFLFRSGLVLAFRLMSLFRIELLSTGVTYNRVAVCKMARASCPVGRLRVRSHLYGREQRFVAQIVMHFAGVCLLRLMGSGLLHQH